MKPIRNCLAVVATSLGILFALQPAQCEDSPARVLGIIERKDPALDKLIPQGAALEVIADGFQWAEGPIWVKGEAGAGHLLCSDTIQNVIFRWEQGKGISVFRRPSGFAGDHSDLKEPGSNGLTLDSESRLVYCDHGNRRVARLEKDGKTVTALADHFESKRFNSPNDLAYKSNGDLYFTDPPYGLAKKVRKAGEPEFPGMEADYSGVYRLSKDGKLTLLTKEMSKPNGIAFSPDEKTLYVSNSDPDKAVWMAFDVKEDGSLGKGRVFYDATDLVKAMKQGLPDGLKVNKDGDLFAAGPGGILVLTSDAKLLGVLATGVPTSNCNWGDDGSTLFVTADKQLCRIRTKTKGNGW